MKKRTCDRDCFNCKYKDCIISADSITVDERKVINDRDKDMKDVLNPALESGLIKMTLPNKPTSKNQMYYKD